MFYVKSYGIQLIWLPGLLLGGCQPQLCVGEDEDSGVVQAVASAPSQGVTLAQREWSLQEKILASSSHQGTTSTDVEVVSMIIDREEHLLRKFEQRYEEQTNHPDIALSLNNLGVAFTKLGKLHEGLEYQKRSLKMYQELYSDQPHPDLVASLDNVSRAYQALGEDLTALDYLDKALSMRQNLEGYGPSVEVAMSLNNAGMAHQALGQLPKARDYFTQALAMYEVLPNYQPRSATLARVLNNVGKVYQALGEDQKALDHLERAVDMFGALYGETDHLDMVFSLTSMGVAYERLGDVEKGINCQIQALEMRKQLLCNKGLLVQEDHQPSVEASSTPPDEVKSGCESSLSVPVRPEGAPSMPVSSEFDSGRLVASLYAPQKDPETASSVNLPEDPFKKLKTEELEALVVRAQAELQLRSGKQHQLSQHAQGGLEAKPYGAPLKVKSSASPQPTLVASQPVLSAATQEFMFGAKAWKEYFGVTVGSEPSLPENIEAILNSTAPFTLDGETTPQRIRDNHLLVLIPAKVNGESYSLTKLGELVKRYFPGNGNKEGYRDYADDVRKQFGGASPSKSYWLLLTRSVLSGSRESYSDQKAMIQKYSRQGYDLPSGLEAATGILLHYARHRERLFGDNSRSKTYTRCTDTELVVGKWPIVVGGFGASGLGVHSHRLHDIIVFAALLVAGSYRPLDIGTLACVGVGSLAFELWELGGWIVS